ncbi:MAG: lamin tail domain-containing protein, partial [Candidatus Gracilibacteria bacterium]|nr:lamin tail domain-containing protein [Candidatus Gracilibacteria bacterium]
NASADLNDPSGSFIFSAFILAPDEYFAISIDPESYGFRLSDIGSLIEIFDENGIPIASIDYLTPFKGVSVTYDDQILTTLQHPTPNRPNIFANLSPTALISLQGSPRITGCTSLSFNPTGAQSFDPDEDDISYAWTYTNESGDILFTSAEKNPLSFPFTTDLGEYFTVELEATDPFGEMGPDILKLELLICDGRKQTLKEIQSEGVGGVVQYSSDILINELLPNPYGKDTGVEFIELYNRGPESVQLNGWKLGEKTKKKLDGLSIASKGFLIFEKASLLNSKATVELLDPHDDVISSVTYTDAEEGRSYSRDEYDNFRWTAPTPGSLNDFPFEKESVYLQASAPVIITRFLANPKGPDEGQEWIEIQNRTESPVDLTGWQLDDREGASVPYTFPSLILRPKQTLKLSSDTSGITLRNTADQIRLFNDMRQLIDQVEWFTPVADGLILTRSDLVQGENIEPDLAKVIRVVDGDTIDVEMTVDGILKVERVRLIGVDTPETVHPFKPLEFFGQEASNYTKSQL